MTSERALPITFLLTAALGTGCADFSRGPAPIAADAGEAGAAAPDGGVSFAANVEPILVGGCQRCHSTGGEAGDTTFLLTGDAAADLATTTRFIDPNAPASSRLLAKMSGKGHGGGTLYAAGT